jgi:hypothetical protein
VISQCPTASYLTHRCQSQFTTFPFPSASLYIKTSTLYPGFLFLSKPTGLSLICGSKGEDRVSGVVKRPIFTCVHLLFYLPIMPANTTTAFSSTCSPNTCSSRICPSRMYYLISYSSGTFCVRRARVAVLFLGRSSSRSEVSAAFLFSRLSYVLGLSGKVTGAGRGLAIPS